MLQPKARFPVTGITPNGDTGHRSEPLTRLKIVTLGRVVRLRHGGLMTSVAEIHQPEVESPVEIQVPAPFGRQPEPARPMFADSLLESTGFQRRRRGVAAILSFFVQCLLLGVVLVIPLMFTEALPRQQLLAFLVAPTPPPPPPPPAAPAAKVIRQVESDLISNGE